MRPRDVARTLRALIPTKVPIFLWGPPGIGKTNLMQQAARDLDLMLLELRASLLDPTDLRGLPRVSSDKAQWVPPAFLPDSGRGVVFCDELAHGLEPVQCALLSLLDGKIGEYRLAEGWSTVAASNRLEDRAGSKRVITPMLNRFIHIDVEVSNEDWHAWAVENNIEPLVRSFLNFRPPLLFDFDPAANRRAFCTPRSWARLSKVLSQTPADLLHMVAAGTVGDGPAAEFQGYAEVWRDMPDPDGVLRHPEGSPVPREPSVLYALAGALVERLRGAGHDLLGRFVQFVNRVGIDEIATVAMRDGMAANRKLLTAPGAGEWMKRHKHLLLAA